MFYIEVEVKSFLTVFGLFFAGLAWVLKDYIMSILNGIIIMFSKEFKIGDYIRISDYKGVIKNLTFLNTVVYTDEGDITYIPNNLLLSKETINYSKSKTKKTIFTFEINKNKFKDITKIEKYIIKILQKEYSDEINFDNFFMKITEILENKVSINVEIPLKSYNFKIEKDIQKFLSVKLLKYLSR